MSWRDAGTTSGVLIADSDNTRSPGGYEGIQRKEAAKVCRSIESHVMVGC